MLTVSRLSSAVVQHHCPNPCNTTAQRRQQAVTSLGLTPANKTNKIPPCYRTCGVPSSPSASLALGGDVGVLGYSCDSARPATPSPSAAAVAGALLPCCGGSGLAAGLPFVPPPCFELHMPMLVTVSLVGVCALSCYATQQQQQITAQRGQRAQLPWVEKNT